MSETFTFSSTIKSGLDEDFDFYNENDPMSSMKNLDEIYVKRNEADLETKKFIKPGFEQNYTIDYFHMGKRASRKLNKEERSKTAGSDWFNIKAPELTDEVKGDLEVIKMRRALFKKHQYKRKATEKLSEHFHLGKVIEGSADYYSSRINKKEQGKSIVDELLKDAQFLKSSKEKYNKIITENVEYKKERAIRKQIMKKRGVIKRQLKNKSEWENRSKEAKKLKNVKNHQKRLKKNK